MHAHNQINKTIVVIMDRFNVHTALLNAHQLQVPVPAAPEMMLHAVRLKPARLLQF